MSVEIVAELGLNHNGSFDTACALIEAAADCGCDSVKLQAYETRDFLASGHPDWKLFRSRELEWGEIEELSSHARAAGLRFGATPTSVEGVERCAGYVDFLKNGSDFLLRLDMIRAMAATGLPTVISTGMANRREIDRATGNWLFGSSSGAKLTVLLCTSAYPCLDEAANLLRLVTLHRSHIEANFGYSDHTIGVVAAIAAAALGATMIEKHFTLSKDDEGPDHWFSANPREMRALCEQVRRVEKMLGSGEIGPQDCELEGRDKWRVVEGGVRAV